MNAIETNKKLLELIAEEKESERFRDHGEWAPLSVWGKRGYDTSRIERFSKESDKRDDRLFGTVYRVWVQSNDHELEKTVTKREREQVTSKTEPPKQLLALEDGAAGSDDSDDDSGSSSSSSSSSSGGKKSKKKKAKKSKKSKKASKKEKKAAKKNKKDTANAGDREDRIHNH